MSAAPIHDRADEGEDREHDQDQRHTLPIVPVVSRRFRLAPAITKRATAIRHGLDDTGQYRGFTMPGASLMRLFTRLIPTECPNSALFFSLMATYRLMPTLRSSRTAVT